MKDLYVLTAAIEPRLVPVLARVDWDIRRADYTAALAFYARSLDPANTSILLIESTGADVQDLRTVACEYGHRLEILSYCELPSISEKGKGNAEAVMFDRVSDWLAKRPGTFHSVTKVTGRLKVTNHQRLIRATRQTERFVSCRISSDLQQVDTKFFITDPLTWTQHLVGLEPLVNEARGRYLEHAVARSFAEARFNEVPWIRFSGVLRIQGVSGSTGQSYSSPKKFVRDYAGIIARVMVGRGYL